MKKQKKKGRVKDFEMRYSQEIEKESLAEETFLPVEEPVRIEPSKRKKKKVRINRGRIVSTVIILILIAVVGVSLKNVVTLHIEQSQLKEENKQLKSDKSSLESELKNVNDKSYIEEQARIQLRLIKPGEILYILDDKSDENKKDSED